MLSTRRQTHRVCAFGSSRVRGKNSPNTVEAKRRPPPPLLMRKSTISTDRSPTLLTTRACAKSLQLHEANAAAYDVTMMAVPAAGHVTIRTIHETCTKINLLKSLTLGQKPK